MNRIIAAALFAAIATSAATAQEFAGTCKDLTEATTCGAAGWCQWIERKEMKLPDGTTFKPASYCRFKSGMKAAWNAKTNGQ